MRRKKSRVEDWSDERSHGNGIIVTLKWGWCFDRQEHIKGFDTISEAWEAVNDSYRCNCKECLQNKGK